MGMTNEEALEIIGKAQLSSKYTSTEVFQVKRAFQHIKSALEQQPSEDCISREQTLKAFAEKCGGECACCEYNGSGYDNAENCKLIKSMPSVTPSRPKGKWIIKDKMWLVCSVCGCQTRMMKKYNVPNYCPACGADMRESE